MLGVDGRVLQALISGGAAATGMFWQNYISAESQQLHTQQGIPSGGQPHVSASDILRGDNEAVALDPEVAGNIQGACDEGLPQKWVQYLVHHEDFDLNGVLQGEPLQSMPEGVPHGGATFVGASAAVQPSATGQVQPVGKANATGAEPPPKRPIPCE